MDTVNLKWTNLRSLKEIFSIREKSGVYIWGFYRDNFIPYMVGKATGNTKYSTICGRLVSHVSCLIGGEYVIHKKENLKQFYEFKDESKRNELASSDVFNEENFLKFVKEHCGKLKEHIDEMVNNFHFTCAYAEPIYVSDMEKSVINIIGIEKLWNKKAGKPSEYEAIPDDLRKVISF